MIVPSNSIRDICINYIVLQLFPYRENINNTHEYNEHWGNKLFNNKISFCKNPYPVLLPGPEWLDAAATYNPAVLYVNNTFYMFYRAQYRFHGTSITMLAISRDEIHFNKTHKMILYPTLAEEMSGRCEDPRIVVVNNIYYMTYTAYNGRNARLALARSKDLIHWEKLGLVQNKIQL
ncbi:MAG: hypothetical protein J7L82_05730 [Staphylothermus sp.]|nr:hypothetical protein [Staphylothermus sp.]